MPAERSGYTVTMFVIDVSPSMANQRNIELPNRDGSTRTTVMSSLQWSLQYVMYKIQEMIFHGRKTDQCGVMLFGSTETNNVVNEEHGDYEHVSLYIPIGQPNAGTLAKLAALETSNIIGDPINGLIVAIETQARYLKTKTTWTRKMVMVTDGENPLELDSWEDAAEKFKELNIRLAVLGVDFDDEDCGFKYEDKSDIKLENEKFWQEFCDKAGAVLGTCEYALQEVAKPDPKEVKSAPLGYVLRVGDVDADPETSVEIAVRASKGTGLMRPPSIKKFAKRDPPKDENGVPIPVMHGDQEMDIYALVKTRTEFALAKDLEAAVAAAEAAAEAEAEAAEGDDQDVPRVKKVISLWDNMKDIDTITKETLTRCYKYGATWVDVEADFERLSTKKGIDICAFFPVKNIRRELFMSEVQFLWPDPASGKAQVAFSSIVQAMFKKELAAVSRWVTRDGADPKMGILIPRLWDNIDSFSWIQVPFADDLRKYAFRSLDSLTNLKGDAVKRHAYLPTSAQRVAMDEFVDGMDLMRVGEKDENGERTPWYDPRASFNPAVHRVKQALFHAAIVPDLDDHPVPPPHPDLLQYFDPPPKMLKRGLTALDTCRETFNVVMVPKRTFKRRAEMHVEATGDDGLILGPSKQFPRLEPIEEPDATNPQTPNGADPSPADEDEGSSTEPDVDITSPLPEPVPSVPEDTGVEIAMDEDLPINRAVPEGRIIGFTDPLADFKGNINSGDLVSKAVEDLAYAIQEIALKPFASRRHEELLNCLRELRSTCLNEDEIEAWNESIRELKDVCMSSSPPNNHAFWKQIQAVGITLGLISRAEAAKVGGRSSVSDAAADKFMR